MLWEHATRRQDGIGTSLPSVSLAKLPEAKLYHLIIANIQNKSKQHLQPQFEW
jgi:hypothetical protein